MSFPVNLLTTEEIVAELQRREKIMIDGFRAEIAQHAQAIVGLQAQLDLLKKIA